MDIKETYLPIVKKAFPDALISFIGNQDDYNSAIDITPDHFYTLRLLVSFNKNFFVRLIVFHYGQDPKNIYAGFLPAAEEGPDFDFLEKVLRNWREFVSP